MITMEISVRVDLEELQKLKMTPAQLQALMQGIGQVVAAQQATRKTT